MTDPHAGKWIRPKFNRLRAADPHYGFVRNVYYRGEPWQDTIGLAFYWGQSGVGVRWRKPRTPKGWIREGKPDEQ